jgi:hypothetical protein
MGGCCRIIANVVEWVAGYKSPLIPLLQGGGFRFAPSALRYNFHQPKADKNHSGTVCFGGDFYKDFA